MNHVRSFVFALVAGAALIMAPQAAHAQQAITTDFEGGIAVAGGDLADAVKPGPALTAGVNFRVHDMFSIRLEGGVDLYGTEDVADPTVDGGTLIGPDVSHTRLDLGILFHALRPDETGGLWADLDVGGGYHILSTDNYEIVFPSSFESIDISKGYLGFKGGVAVGYRVHDAVSVFAGGDAYMTPGDADDLEPFTVLEEVDDGAESHWSFPVQAGLRFHFQP